MRLQSFLIALLVSSLFIIVPISFMYYNYDDMGVTIDSNTNASFSAFEKIAGETKGQMYNMTSDIQKRSPGGDEVNANTDQTYEDNLIKASTRVLSLIPQSFSTFNKALQQLGSSIGLGPMASTFLGVAFSVMIIIICFIFISSLFKVNV